MLLTPGSVARRSDALRHLLGCHRQRRSPGDHVVDDSDPVGRGAHSRLQPPWRLRIAGHGVISSAANP
jgi:hypothetical protein